MATMAEWFRYNTERSGPKQKKFVPRQPRDGEATAHNQSARAGKNAAYALEEAPGRRPSRKSTRKGANRQKTDVQFRLRRQTGESRQSERPRAPAR